MPDVGIDDIGMPPWGCREATGGRRKDDGLPSSGVRLPLLPPEAIQETESLFLL